jgi:hypothetical protein
VIEDCHRALGNHQMVEKYWRELAEASPHPELLAEGRIVMAGSLCDRKLFEEAHALMEKAAGDMKRPSEYHLRQWFVIADIYDKQGNVIQASQKDLPHSAPSRPHLFHSEREICQLLQSMKSTTSTSLFLWERSRLRPLVENFRREQWFPHLILRP